MKTDYMLEKLDEVLTPELDKIPSYDWMKFKPFNKAQTVEIDSLLENHIWVTAYKKKLFVREMSTNHINNCINCFEGTGNMTIPDDYLGGKEKWLKIFNEELTKRQ